MPQFCLAFKTTGTPCIAKISESQIKKEKYHWLILNYVPVSTGNSKRLIFWDHLSFSVRALELTLPLSFQGSADSCSAQRGVKADSPEEMIWNWRTCYFLSLPCAKTSSHLYLFYSQQNPPLLVQAKRKRQFASPSSRGRCS